jgi:WD40 repeat protein
MSLEVLGDKLISGSDDFLVRVWSTSSWICEAVLRGHQVNIIFFFFFYIIIRSQNNAIIASLGRNLVFASD